MRMTAKIKSGTTIINIVRAAISFGASSSSISPLDQTNNLEKQKQQNRYYDGLTNRSSERLSGDGLCQIAQFAPSARVQRTLLESGYKPCLDARRNAKKNVGFCLQGFSNQLPG